MIGGSPREFGQGGSRREARLGGRRQEFRQGGSRRKARTDENRREAKTRGSRRDARTDENRREAQTGRSRQEARTDQKRRNARTSGSLLAGRGRAHASHRRMGLIAPTRGRDGASTANVREGAEVLPTPRRRSAGAPATQRARRAAAPASDVLRKARSRTAMMARASSLTLRGPSSSPKRCLQRVTLRRWTAHVSPMPLWSRHRAASCRRKPKSTTIPG